MNWIALISKLLPMILTIIAALFGQDAVTSAWTLSQSVGASDPMQWFSTFGVNASGTVGAGLAAWFVSHLNSARCEKFTALNARIVELVAADSKARELFAVAFGRDPKTIDRLI